MARSSVVRWPAAMVAALAMLLSIGLAAPAASASAPDDVSFILATVRADGAIATNPDKRLVWPYLSNFAAMGLARVAGTDRRAAEAGWRWAEWYQAHQDVNGFVTDYVEAPSGLRSTGRFDSTDAYAGTYLMAVSDLVDATGDLTRLAGVGTGVRNAVSAIQATQDTDGLTWATPSWRVKYLMDQAETFGGLVAAVHLADLLGDPTLRATAESSATRLRDGVARLWNPATQAYDWAVHGNGARQATRWQLLYPDAMQQAWAVAFGLDPGGHAVEILDRLQREHPGWASPSGRSRTDRGMVPTGYWAVATWALARTGRATSDASVTIRSDAARAGRVWPYTSAVAGQQLVLDSGTLPRAAVAPPVTTVLGRAEPAAARSTTTTTIRPWSRRSRATGVPASGRRIDGVVVQIGAAALVVAIDGRMRRSRRKATAWASVSTDASVPAMSGQAAYSPVRTRTAPR